MTHPTLFNHQTATAVPVDVSRGGGGGGARNGSRRAEGSPRVHPTRAGSCDGDGSDAAGVGTTAAAEGSPGAAAGLQQWAAVAALFTSPVLVRELSDRDLEDRLGLLGRAKSRLAAMDAEAVAELARRRGEARAADVLRDKLKQSRGAAKRDVELAGRLGQVPGTSQALAEGAITPHHARLIAEAAEQASPGAPIDEAELLAAARREPADLFGRTVRDHLNERSGDDLQERRKRQRAQRS